MASGYWKKITDRMHAFIGPGDTLKCVDVKKSARPRTCDLCDHSPITWLHYLENTRTGKRLVVGSECILNLKKVYRNERQEALTIWVDKHLEPWADKMNKKSPNTITVVHNTEPAVEQWDRDLEDQYDIEDEDLDEEFDLDELAPEGMGSDEINRDSG